MEPEAKKIKLEVGMLRMECVLEDKFINDLPTVEVYVGRILERKNISQIIVTLNTLHPIPILQHLKRIRKGSEILICLSEKVKNVGEFLNSIGFQASLLDGNFFKTQVASEAPKTRKQFVQSNQMWPCNFHEDKYIEKLVNNDYSEEELNSHEKWMQMALNIRGTVIVDPKYDLVKGCSGDLVEEHPLKHSTMVAIDNVASMQGGGAWEPSNPKEPKGDEYLCTSYYAYLFKEPCTMCAMALVHSRINKVFYSIPSPNGALGSATKLHGLKPLNHHFEVYKGLLYQEGIQLETK